MSGTRSDGRRVAWLVEIWIERWGHDDGWTATVKGEIDIDDELGDDYCDLNVQRSVTSVEEAVEALIDCAALVVGHQVEGLK